MGENVKRKWLQDQLMGTFGPRIKIVKNHQSALSGAGLPDTFMQQPQLGGVHLEFKYVKGLTFDWAKEPSKLQKQTLRELWLAGANVGVIAYWEASQSWTSVHNTDLMSAINTEYKWTQLNHWPIICPEDFLRVGAALQKKTLARLVWDAECL